MNRVGGMGGRKWGTRPADWPDDSAFDWCTDPFVELPSHLRWRSESELGTMMSNSRLQDIAAGRFEPRLGGMTWHDRPGTTGDYLPQCGVRSSVLDLSMPSRPWADVDHVSTDLTLDGHQSSGGGSGSFTGLHLLVVMFVFAMVIGTWDRGLATLLHAAIDALLAALH